ncbi:hypothetical protein K1719_029791 [Acacia pycnantha]|nr:hypothetical protein K1719_029791 [Acacia pycnantha]
MLFKRFPAFWASSSYASVLDKTDVVVALFSVKMVRTGDGQTTFHSHSDISEVVDFRLKLNRLSAAHLTQDNQIPGWSCHEFEECDVVTKVTIQKCETLYGWVYDACPCDKKPEYMPNGALRCTKCDKDVLMTVPKFKVHYKVYDKTGKCSVIFFDRHACELLGKSA